MVRFYGFLLSAMMVMALATPTHARAAAAITGVEVEVLDNGHERVKFITSRPLTPGKVFRLDNPSRVVIDIPSVPVTGIALPSDYHGKLLTGVRFGQFNPKTSRLVIDTAAPLNVIATHGGIPLVVELASPVPLSAPVAAPAGAKPAAPAAKPTSVAEPEDEDDITPVTTPAAAPIAPPAKHELPKQAPPTAPVKTHAKPAAISAEEKKPLVVIDAGHGGQDPGALGLHDTHEKDVTLNFARALRSALLHTGRYRVVLTRDDDTFVSLQERVNIARKAKGNVFISFHADSNPHPDARGLSIYTLSETASDDEAAALAEHENKADIIQGVDLSTTDADVASILIDLTQRETMNKSATLADIVVESLHAKVNRLPKTHRFAGFRVLKGPDIPSTLIELGFLSNAADERLLLSPEYRDLVVTSVARGIDRYLAGE